MDLETGLWLCRVFFCNLKIQPASRPGVLRKCGRECGTGIWKQTKARRVGRGWRRRGLAWSGCKSCGGDTETVLCGDTMFHAPSASRLCVARCLLLPALRSTISRFVWLASKRRTASSNTRGRRNPLPPSSPSPQRARARTHARISVLFFQWFLNAKSSKTRIMANLCASKTSWHIVTKLDRCSSVLL